MKVEFIYKGKKYFVYCRSFEIENKMTWFYFKNDVKYIKGIVRVTWVFIPSSKNALDGYTDYPFAK